MCGFDTFATFVISLSAQPVFLVVQVYIEVVEASPITVQDLQQWKTCYSVQTFAYDSSVFSRY